MGVIDFPFGDGDLLKANERQLPKTAGGAFAASEAPATACMARLTTAVPEDNPKGLTAET